MTDKQKEVLNFLEHVETATLTEIHENVSFSYYHNANKYLGLIMKRLIEIGKVTKVRKGIFKLNREIKTKNKELELF